MLIRRAGQQLDESAASYWGRRDPAIVPAWLPRWEQVVPFFAYPRAVRKII
jgi:putative transposase